MKYLIPPFLLIFPLATAQAAPQPDRLEYKNPAGVTYIISADGLSEVRLGDRIVAQGGWRFRVGDAIWGFPAGPDAETISTKTLEIVSPTEARVTHTHVQRLVRHTFTFSGEDVRIESWVENHHPTATIRVPMFEGPRIEFGKPPRGLLPIRHSSYTADHGPVIMHPGGIRIGGSYGIGVGFGVGAAPHDAGIHDTAIIWDWDWNKREADTGRTPKLFVNSAIPPQTASTFAVTFRFSRNAEWTHLLDPYRRHLHALFGEKPQYDRSGNLPLVSGVVCGTQADRGPGNLHCFEPHRRLDSVFGVTTYLGQIAPDMRAIPTQGLILWGQGGYNPRGAMYRPDFDILPPDVVPNIVRLAGLLKEQRMKLGMAARPGQMVQPLNYTIDTVNRINPTEPDQLEILTSRFNNAIKMGASLFYLDSFGNRLDDVTIMRAVRAGVGKQPGIGRAVQTYTEHPADVIVPTSGLLTALAGNAADGSLGIYFAGDFWLNPPETPTMQEVMRYFYPDVPIVGLVGQVRGVETDAGKQKVVEYCYKLRMTPIIPDDWLGSGSMIGNWMSKLTRQYLTPDGQWRDKPE
jgi:hypothetical protein